MTESAGPPPLAVCLLNNYSMRKALQLYEAGKLPGHHLWGVKPTRSELSWVVPMGIFDLPFGHGQLTWKLRQGVLRLVGDPLQQARALLSRRSKVEVIFAADQWSGSLVGLLSRLRINRKPYVVVIHHNPTSRWNRFCLRGASAVLVLSEPVRRAVESSLGLAADHVAKAPWGPDRHWSGYEKGNDSRETVDFVSAGRTNRDHALLIDAVRTARLTGTIFDGKRRTEYVHGEATSSTKGSAGYPEIIERMAAAATVVIPLADPSALSGLTEIADAAALGVPVVVTRNDVMPYDIVGSGAGVTVDAGNRSALIAGIDSASAMDEPAARRALATAFNLDAYQELLLTVLRGQRNIHSMD